MLLAFTALASTFVAFTTELAFACAGRGSWLMQPGPLGLVARRVYRGLDRGIPVLVGTAATAALVLAFSTGIATRAGWLGLAGSLALGAHLGLDAKLARPFHEECACLEAAKVPARELAALKARWEMAVTTRASLLAAALVCTLAAAIMR